MARPQAPLGWVTDQTDHGPKAEENPEGAEPGSCRLPAVRTLPLSEGG